MKGILFIPYNTNGDTMKNIISVMLHPGCVKEFGLPSVDAITFLEPPGAEDMSIEGQKYSPSEGCAQLLKQLNCYDTIQTRKTVVKNPASNIPKLILSAVSEVGKDRIAIDLTNGKKDMTGALYASACICEISNILYVTVKKDPESNQFYKLDIGTKDIFEKISLTKFDALSEMEGLASASFIDFIRYKAEIGALRSACSSKLISDLDGAVEAYFSGRFVDAVRSIGNVNETLVVQFGRYFSKVFDKSVVSINGKVPGKAAGLKDQEYSFAEIWKSVRNFGPRLKLLLCLQEKYIHLLEKKRSIEEDAAFNQLHSFFKSMATAFYYSETIRIYRNQVAQKQLVTISRDDVKLLLSMLVKILRGCFENGCIQELKLILHTELL